MIISLETSVGSKITIFYLYCQLTYLFLKYLKVFNNIIEFKKYVVLIYETFFLLE